MFSCSGRKDSRRRMAGLISLDDVSYFPGSYITLVICDIAMFLFPTSSLTEKT